MAVAMSRNLSFGRRLAAVALTAAGLVLALAGPASAHATLAGSDPTEGARLDRSPAAVTLRFTESVQLSATTAELTDGHGRRLTVGPIRLLPSAAGAGTEQPVQLRIGLPALPADSYRLAWRTLSSDDLHQTSGVLVFGVGQPAGAAAGAGVAEPAPAPAEAAARWVLFFGAGTLLGGLLLALLVARRPAAADGPALVRRLLAAATAGGAVAFVAAPVLLGVQAAAGPGGLAGLPGLLTGDGYGLRWAVRLAGLAGLLAAALWWRRFGRLSRPLLGLAGAAALLLGAGSALVGHFGANAAAAPLRLAVDAVHQVAALTWAGSVLAAAAVLVPLLRGGGRGALAARAVLRAFGPVAGTSLVVVVLSGIALVGSQVATVDALLTSGYGRVLLVKSAVVALAVALGVGSHLAVRGRWRVRLSTTLLAEAGVLGLALAAAAVLAAAAPARGPAYTASPPSAAAASMSGTAGDLVESLTVAPNRPGSNFVSVGVFDTRRPSPGPIESVTVALAGPGGRSAAQPARRGASGTWVLPVDAITAPGTWRVTVEVSRPGLPVQRLGYDWLVPDAGARPTVVSRAALSGPLDVTALGGLLLAAAAGGLLWRRGRAGRGPMVPPTGDSTTNPTQPKRRELVGSRR